MSACGSSSNETSKSKFGRLSVNYFPLCRIQQAMNHQIKAVQQSSTSVMDAINSSDSEENDRDSLDEDEESVFGYSGNASWSSDEIPETNILPFDVDVQGAPKIISSATSPDQMEISHAISDNSYHPFDINRETTANVSHHNRRRRHRRHHGHRGCSQHGLGMCGPYQCEILKFRQGPVTTPLPATTVERLNNSLAYDCSTPKKDISMEDSEKGDAHVTEKQICGDSSVSGIKPVTEDPSVNLLMSSRELPDLPGYGHGPNVHVCRFCHMPGEVNRPLINPCRCRGSLKFIHQDCLLTWLSVSKTKKRHYAPVCELCNYTYRRRRTFQLLQCRFPEVSRQDRVYHLICVLSFLLMLMGAMATLFCFFVDRSRGNHIPRMHPGSPNPSQETVDTEIASGYGIGTPNGRNNISLWIRNNSHSTVAPPLPAALFASTSKGANQLASVQSTRATSFESNEPRYTLVASGLSLEEVVTLVSGIIFFLAFFVAMIVQIKSRHTLYQLCLRFVQSSSGWRILPYDPNRDKDNSLAACPPYHYLHAPPSSLSVTSPRIAPYHSTQNLSPYAETVPLKEEAPEQVCLLTQVPIRMMNSVEPPILESISEPQCSLPTCNEEVVLILPPGVTINAQDILYSKPTTLSATSDFVHFNILSTLDQSAFLGNAHASARAMV